MSYLKKANLALVRNKFWTTVHEGNYKTITVRVANEELVPFTHIRHIYEAFDMQVPNPMPCECVDVMPRDVLTATCDGDIKKIVMDAIEDELRWNDEVSCEPLI